jgi:hypothetical protein
MTVDAPAADTGAHVRKVRVRPSIRRAAIATCLLLAPLLAHRVWDYIEVRRLLGEIEAIQQRHEPLTTPESTTALPPNGSDRHRAGLALLAAGTLALGSVQQPALSAMHEWLAGATVVANPQVSFGEPLAAVVDRSGDALALADKARTLGFDGLPAGLNYSYRTAGLMGLERLLSARTLSLALADHGDDAVESLLTTLMVRRALVDWAIAGAGHNAVPGVVSLSHPSDAALLRLQQTLAADDERSSATAWLLAARARLIEDVWRQLYGPGPGVLGNVPQANRGVAAWLLRPWFTHGLVSSLRVWAELIDASRRTGRPRIEAARAVSLRYGLSEPVTLRRSLAGGMFSPMAMQVAAVMRSERQILDRASVVALAIARYRLAHAGRVPTTLADLVPAYLDAVPEDPLAGRPLLFRTLPDSFIVYSVGADGRDDGGTLASELQETIRRGWGPRAILGLDTGVRVLVR